MDMNSLAHTKWECKYHIVFAPKFRRKVIYGQIKADVGNILSMLCKRKGIEIIEAECMPDHVHMFVRIPPKYSVSQIVGYLKGKSSLMIFERHANLKYKYGNRHFWCRGYYVDTVERNARVIEEYISLAVKSRKMQTTAGKYHFERFVVRRFFAAAVEKQPRSRIASSVPVTTGVPASSPFSRAALMVTHPAISVYQLALSY